MNSGFVRTFGGGSIDVTALSGNVNTGTHANGFIFRPDGIGYVVDQDLGGISTGNGGNVSITAGQDIISYLPSGLAGIQTDGGSGAFGAAAGNVTLNAGRDVLGHFVVRNGEGFISAGRDAGTSGRSLALSLVKGDWTVNAANNILLQEVRNPNGIFNNLGFSTSTTKYHFDYSPDDKVTLVAGNGVQLLGSSLPRYDTDDFEQSILPIYPGSLYITAGAGGILLGNDVTLFPSPQGQLHLTTTSGGSLAGTKPGAIVQLVMSDSGKSQYLQSGDFGIADHAAIPLHLNDSDPIQLNIAGDMSNILLGAPKFAHIKVGGDMINSRFDGQNLHASDVTSIDVTGDIVNRNEFTSILLATPPDFSVFDHLDQPLSAGLAGLPNLFSYNPTTKLLTFQGRLNGDQLQALQTLMVRVWDQYGLPVLDASGNPVVQPAQFISSADLAKLSVQSADIPDNPDTGYRLGGGGQFNFTAHNLDLGATVGIVSQGPRGNAALAKYFTRGANINVSLGGNLDMFSTTISSLNGGNITVVADGNVNAGSRDFVGNDKAARGIFTGGPKLGHRDCPGRHQHQRFPHCGLRRRECHGKIVGRKRGRRHGRRRFGVR